MKTLSEMIQETQDLAKRRTEESGHFRYAAKHFQTPIGEIEVYVTVRQNSNLRSWSFPVRFQLNGKVISKANLQERIRDCSNFFDDNCAVECP